MPYRNMSEDYKIDVCLLSGSTTSGGLTAGTEVTPVMNYPMKGYDKALFIVSMGAQKDYGSSALGAAFGSTCASTSYNVWVRALQATGSTGTPVLLGSSIQIGSYTTPYGHATTGADMITLLVGTSLVNADYVTINDQTFTFENIAATVAMGTSRSISSTDTPASVAAQLSSYINSGTYGCTGLHSIVTADSTLVNTITVYSEPFGEKAMNVLCIGPAGACSSAGPIRMRIDRCVGYIEVDARDLASSSNMTHVSIGVTAASSGYPVSVVLLRGSASRYSVPRGQYVNKYDDVV